ncbi:MAG: hypothetical protein ACE5FN_08440 [Leptospirillia bacterium]
MRTLDNILKGDEVEKPAEHLGEANSAEPEPLDGFGPTGDTAGPPPEKDGTTMVPVSALIDERRKRKEAEARVAAMTEPLTEATGSVNDVASRNVPEADIRVDRDRLDTSEEIARVRYPDFEEKVNAFVRLTAADPGLVDRMSVAPDPAAFAYLVGSQVLAAAGGSRIPAEREGIPALPESLSDTPSAGDAGSGAPWTPKSIDDILKGVGING